MAGPKIIETVTGSLDDPDRYKTRVFGLPLTVIVENGNVEPDDEWALFRLTDDGLHWYGLGAEFAAGIMALQIDKKPAIVEISRHSTKEEALEVKRQLSEDERKRTLIRSVKPKK